MTKSNRLDNARNVKAPHGTELSCKSWLTEAPMRMLMNNLDPDVAEDPDNLIIYGGSGKAARSWPDYDRIIAALKQLENDGALLAPPKSTSPSASATRCPPSRRCAW